MKCASRPTKVVTLTSILSLGEGEEVKTTISLVILKTKCF
jgi:hypothetical protein